MAATVKSLAAARLAETGSWRVEGDRSAAHQLARRTGTSVVQAASAIDTARRLESLPAIASAARRGELSAEQACAIADAAGSDPGAEHDLLEAARRSPLAELRGQCARTKAAAPVDLEARRRRIHQRRSLRSFTDAEGEWHLHCRNNPEVGARIMAALDPDGFCPTHRADQPTVPAAIGLGIPKDGCCGVQGSELGFNSWP